MEPIQKHESKNSGSVTSGGRIKGPLSRIQRDLEEVAVFFSIVAGRIWLPDGYLAGRG